MPSYILISGAGGDPSYWQRVEPLLRERGHDVVAVDLPAEDDTAGLAEYVAVIEAGIDDRQDVILVAQSMGALSASVVASRRKVDRLVLVAPMIPTPGETGGDWWANTGQGDAARAYAEEQGRSTGGSFDPFEVFLHDVPPEVVESGPPPRDQSGRPFEDPWPLDSWPEVETRVIAGRHDRLFPLDFMRRLSRERLGVEPDVIESGHLPALARPEELVELLESYRTLGPGSSDHEERQWEG